MPQTFPQFALLPLELRQAIWKFAVLGWTQDIHLSLSKSKEVWESPFDSRKHLFASELAEPPLLYACHDSRVAALSHYTLGLNVDAKNAWSWRSTLFRDDEFRECPYDKALQECGKRTYWAPESDVIVLEHGEEPYTCDDTSICNSLGAFRRHEYKLDKRIKYMAVTMDVWNGGSGSIHFEVPALEVLFVLVDKLPCFSFLGSGSRNPLTALESIQKESCRIIEGQMTEAVRTDAALFHLKRDRDVGISVQVVLVEGLDELVEKVGARRRESKLRKMKDNTMV